MTYSQKRTVYCRLTGKYCCAVREIYTVVIVVMINVTQHIHFKTSTFPIVCPIINTKFFFTVNCYTLQT